MPFRALAFAGAIALLASPSLRAMDDWEKRINIHPDTLIRGVSVPSAFKGLDGKTQPSGLYDLKLQKGTQGILIGLLRNGKTVGEFPGKFVPGAADPPGGATQGHDISVRKAGMGDGSVKPGQAQMQDFHFDVSSRVSFGDGGGAGKISCSNNLHPGGANLGSISFLLPAVQVQGK
jgi:hypothetical protein